MENWLPASLKYFNYSECNSRNKVRVGKNPAKAKLQSQGYKVLTYFTILQYCFAVLGAPQFGIIELDERLENNFV